MKRLWMVVLLSSLMVTVTSAQSKKELQETINDLNQAIGELRGRISIMEQQLQEAKGTIATLQQENMALKKQLASDAASAAKPMTYRDSIAAVLTEYLSAETWEGRLKNVMEPDRVRPLMEKYYQSKGYRSSIPSDVTNWSFEKIQGKSHTIYKVRDGFYVVKTAEGYKVDWEATVEYIPFKVAEMKKVPGQEYVFRGWMMAYQYAYSNDTYLCYSIGDDVYVYAKKNTPVAKTLLELIPESDSSNIVVKLKYDKVAEAFLITEVISKTTSLY